MAKVQRCRAASGRFTRCRKGSRIAGLGASDDRPPRRALTWRAQPNESARSESTQQGIYLAYPNIGYTAWAAAWREPQARGRWVYLDDAKAAAERRAARSEARA